MLDREAALEAILPAVFWRGIYCRRHFGPSPLEAGNMDPSAMIGVEIVNHVLLRKQKRAVHADF